MGAVTAALYTSLYNKNKKIKGMILDSPFKSVK